MTRRRGTCEWQNPSFIQETFVRYRKILYSGLIASAVVACDTESPSAPSDITPQHSIFAEIPPDPNPGEPGYWIGFSDTECAAELMDDLDQDGLRDTCEQRLAEFFRPYLVMSSQDPVRDREPYWAAKFSYGNVQVFWAYAYYEDGGTADKTAWYCHTGIEYIFETWTCAAHPGDSESLVLDLRYNEATQHWELANLLMSRHGTYYNSLGGQLQYNGPDLGYPTVYVSYGKHANYPSDGTCDTGADFDSDECYSNHFERDYFSAYRNLGSSTNQLLDCVESEGLYASSGRKECFWDTSGSFTGWTGLQPNVTVAQYGVMLRDRGF